MLSTAISSTSSLSNFRSSQSLKPSQSLKLAPKPSVMNYSDQITVDAGDSNSFYTTFWDITQTLAQIVGGILGLGLTVMALKHLPKVLKKNI